MEQNDNAVRFGERGAGLWLAPDASVETLQARRQGKLTICKSNLKNLATGLEKYATDHHGHYPERLNDLVGDNYLQAIPTCPQAGSLTYTDYVASRNPDNFTLSCCGNNHARGGPNYFDGGTANFPHYVGAQGLIEPHKR